MDYIINPVKMGGLVKNVSGDMIKIHLHGRLGVFIVPRSLIIDTIPIEPGHDLEFYFSYIQVVEDPFDYDDSDMTPDHEPQPCLIGGKIIEVNDTAISVSIMNNKGTINVPRRWAFTPIPMQVGQDVQFYLSCMKIVGKKDIPIESI